MFLTCMVFVSSKILSFLYSPTKMLELVKSTLVLQYKNNEYDSEF